MSLWALWKMDINATLCANAIDSLLPGQRSLDERSSIRFELPVQLFYDWTSGIRSNFLMEYILGMAKWLFGVDKLVFLFFILSKWRSVSMNALKYT